MPELRLRTFDESDTEPEVYPFPRAMMDHSHAAGLLLESAHTSDDEPIDSIELAAHIEETLDQLQRRLDRVKNELESVYRFPDPEDWRPTAA